MTSACVLRQILFHIINTSGLGRIGGRGFNVHGRSHIMLFSEVKIISDSKSGVCMCDLVDHTVTNRKVLVKDTIFFPSHPFHEANALTK